MSSIRMMENNLREEAPLLFVQRTQTVRHESRIVHSPSGCPERHRQRRWSSAHFVRRFCNACHVQEIPLPRTLAALPPLGSLTANAGCLAPEVPESAPDYGFTDEERRLLGEVVAHAAALDEPLPADLAVAHAMTALDCVACHARPDVGGPTPEMLALFTSNDDAELGDEGRIPPALDDVGNKLRLETITDILANGTKVRPYMHARMPVFAAPQITDLPTNLAAVDAIAADGREPEFTPERATIGHRLVGTDGVSCVQCHTAGGHPARRAGRRLRGSAPRPIG